MQAVRSLTLYGIPDDHKVLVRSAGSGRLSVVAPGNCRVPWDLGDPRIALQTAYIGGLTPSPRLKLSPVPRVVFNATANPETNWTALGLAQRVCAEALRRGMGVVNPPEAVARTCREDVAERLQGIERLHVPRVARYQALPALLLLKRVESGELPFPFLIRTADGFGPGWIRIEGRETMRRLNLLPFDGRDFHVAPYRECRGTDGLYRRYRMIKVGERLFPRHLIFSDRWRVSVRDRPRIMQGRQDLADAERAFLADPFGLLGKEQIGIIREALTRVGLDYAALDFTLDPVDGLVLLQCDACFDAFADDDSPPRATDTIGAIRRALCDLLLARAGEEAVTQS